MVGKYRSIGVAEKRAMLEAAGEEWPIGSDGEPKVWGTNTTRSAGGSWKLRSTKKTYRWRLRAGLCHFCSSQLDCESNVRCWSCLEKEKERHAFAY